MSKFHLVGVDLSAVFDSLTQEVLKNAPGNPGPSYCPVVRITVKRESEDSVLIAAEPVGEHKMKLEELKQMRSYSDTSQDDFERSFGPKDPNVCPLQYQIEALVDKGIKETMLFTEIHGVMYSVVIRRAP